MPINISVETASLLIIALLNAFTAWMSYKTKQDMRKVEVATNSMKDALVASTAKASHAEGMADQRAATVSSILEKLEVNLHTQPNSNETK